MPKVSVIVPIYGVEKYIGRCAVSLFEQTLDDLEFIFVNDCTLDKSIEILKTTLENYPQRKVQTKILTMSKNSGLPAVRKYGVQHATGEYIIHCDSDDWIDINAYEMLYEKASSGNYDIVFCNLCLSDGFHNQIIKGCFGNLKKENMLFHIIRNSQWSLCGALVKNNIYIENELFFPKDNNGEDFALMIQLVYYASSFAHIPEPLYYYYYNPDSITKGRTYTDYINKIEQHKKNVELVSRFFEGHNLMQSHKDVIVSLMLYARRLLSFVSDQKEYRELWSSIYPELDKMDFLFRRRIPLSLKINYLSVRTHLFFLLKKIQLFINKRFHG